MRVSIDDFDGMLDLLDEKTGTGSSGQQPQTLEIRSSLEFFVSLVCKSHPDRRSRDGLTALFSCARNSTPFSVSLAERLLEAGADPLSLNKCNSFGGKGPIARFPNGMTPFEAAVFNSWKLGIPDAEPMPLLPRASLIFIKACAESPLCDGLLWKDSFKAVSLGLSSAPSSKAHAQALVICLSKLTDRPDFYQGAMERLKEIAEGSDALFRPRLRAVIDMVDSSWQSASIERSAERVAENGETQGAIRRQGPVASV